MSTTSPTYLITAPCGRIGQHLVPILLAQPSKPTLILPTSNAERVSSGLPASADRSRVRIVQGNIQDAQWIEDTLRDNNVTGVFLCLTSDNELFTTFNFLDAIKHSGTVRHLVYLSACGDFTVEAIQAGALQGVAAAHGVVKFIVEAKLRHGLPPRGEKGGFSWTIIGPTLFFSNDLRSKKHLLVDGLFDEPLGSKGVSRVDPQDIALGVANALEDDGKRWAGKKVQIGSLKTYTNVEVAELWAKALGKEIKPFLSDEKGLKEFERQFATKAGGAWARDLRLMYEIFEVQPFGMSQEEYKEQVELLGKEPESYEAFVEKTAKEWRSE